MKYSEILWVLYKIKNSNDPVIRYSDYRQLWAIRHEHLEVKSTFNVNGRSTLVVKEVPSTITFKTTFDYVCALLNEYNNGEPL